MDYEEGGMELVKSAETLEALTRGEIDVQIATAKKWPRTLSKVRETVLELATVDQAAAENCWYAVPRAGKSVDGPSVRLAEIVAASYGNLRVGGRVIGIDAKFVTAQGACHDLENNVAVTTEVRRSITNKAGQRFSEDMVRVTALAATSIAIRNAIFKVVPSAIFKDTFAKIRKVGLGDERNLNETRRALFAYFEGAFDVTSERVLALVEKRSQEDVTLEDIGTLKGLATALKEGTTTVSEAFPASGGSGLKAGRHDARKKPQPAPEAAQPTQEPSEPPATTKAPEQPPETPEVQAPIDAPTEPTKAEMIDEIQDAIDEDVIPFPTVKVICDEIGIDPHDLKEASAEHIKTLHERTVGVMLAE